MRVDALTLFSRMLEGSMGESVIGKAREKQLLELNVSNFRDFSDSKHQTVDDYPYDGGAGMLLEVQPIYDNLRAIEEETNQQPKRVILLDPAGEPSNQKMAEKFSQEEHLVFICGRYESYDERIRTMVTDEVSLGDYILTGGELGTVVMIDVTTRLLPDVLGNNLSAQTNSYSTDLLEHPQYTRPAIFSDMKASAMLTNDNHKLIAEWQLKEPLRRTFLRRPDMLESVEMTPEMLRLLEEIKQEEQK